MSLLLGLRHRLRALLFPAEHAREVEEEMRFHMELDEMHQGEMRTAALRFGNRTYYREEVRRMTWYGWLDIARQDTRYAWRSILRQPGFTAMVMLTLALGIGVNAATFTVLDLLFLHPPGGVEDARMVRRVYVENFNTGDGVPFTSQALSYPMYREVREAVGDTSKVALFGVDNKLRLGKHPRNPTVRAVYATSNYFRVLGAQASMGRVYGTEEDRFGSGAPVVVISHRFWKSQFGGDSTALGREIDFGGRMHRVIGILHPAFSGVELQASDVWIPLAMYPPPTWLKDSWWESSNLIFLRALYRLQPDMSEDQIDLRATQRLRNFERTAFPKHPDTLMTVHSGSLLEARGPGSPEYQSLISTRLAGVALLVMLIAFANVTNLLLARAVRRRHEFAIRLALGVSRTRLVRMLTTETLMLALLATVPAVLMAAWGGTVLRNLLLPDVQWFGTAISVRAVAFAFGTAVIAGLIAGIIPAVQSSNPSLNNELKAATRTGGHHRSRLRSALVGTQAALSLVLLTGSVLFVRSLHNVQSLQIGFDADKLIFGSVKFAEGEKPPAPVIDAGLSDISSRLEGRAGVVSTARAWMQPMYGLTWITFFTAHDSSGSFERGEPTVSTVSRGFFSTVGMKMLRGRDFSGGAPPEVVVNEAFAKRLWPGEDPIGQCMYIKTRQSSCHPVVGVVETARRNKVVDDEPALQYYLPLGSDSAARFGELMIVRTSGAGRAAANELRNGLRSAFPTGEPYVKTMTEQLEPEYRPWLLGASLFTAFGILALLVALVGIYSTVSYSVAQRTHEFGVRIALGASFRGLLRQVIGEGVRTVLVGVLVGVFLVLASGRLVTALLYGVEADDPITMAGVALTLLLASAVAAIVPAWRAARVDPLTALRSE